MLTTKAALRISWFTYKPSLYVLFSGIAIYSMANELFGENCFTHTADHLSSLPWYLTLGQVFVSLITHGIGCEIATKQGVTASHTILSGSNIKIARFLLQCSIFSCMFTAKCTLQLFFPNSSLILSMPLWNDFS